LIDAEAVFVIADCRTWPPMESFIVPLGGKKREWTELCRGGFRVFEGMYSEYALGELVHMWRLTCQVHGSSLLCSTYRLKNKD
jgi:hypothetical protein